MRLLRYTVGAFKAFIAVLALGGFGAGLNVLVQLRHPSSVGIQRLVNIRMEGLILFELVAAAPLVASTLQTKR